MCFSSEGGKYQLAIVKQGGHLPTLPSFISPSRRQALVQLHQHLLRGDGNHRAGAEDGGGAVGLEVLVVLGGNDAANDHHDVLAAELLQLRDQLRQQRLVASG